jgi:predicted ATP-dependent protease
MLRHDVVEAAAAGDFHIYAVNMVDEAVALLTNVAPGDCDDHGVYPEGTLNARVTARLNKMFELHQRFSRETSSGHSNE